MKSSKLKKPNKNGFRPVSVLICGSSTINKNLLKFEVEAQNMYNVRFDVSLNEYPQKVKAQVYRAIHVTVGSLYS